MTFRRSLMFLLLIAVSFLPVITPKARADAPSIDGVKLGMAVAEVEATFASADHKVAIQKTPLSQSILYGQMFRHWNSKGQIDGNRVSTLIGRSQKGVVTVNFSATGEQATYIQRVENIGTNRPPRGQYFETLVARHGKPDYERMGMKNHILYLYWVLEEGKVNCLKYSENKNTVPYHISGIVMQPFLGTIRTPEGKMINNAAASLDDCGIVLEYRLFQDPLNKVEVRLADAAAVARDELALREGGQQ
ncbi:MAG: hypothetical protein CMN55_04740 [Sneathiella sp.]|uniref:hypothetical protein n=1 Tax=Sneathiella sp. TaxID=1964365 RepID=UPI000C35AA6F|nr:hypothetical protein [Sneathiella sp.]MAL78405.1 hypothetical protein [Sneathiella sp.]